MPENQQKPETGSDHLSQSFADETLAATGTGAIHSREIAQSIKLLRNSQRLLAETSRLVARRV